VEYVTEMRNTWERLKGKIDSHRFEHVMKKLEEQEQNAKLWRDVCMEYFGRFVE
jgi:alpha-glucuronidase